MELPSLQTDPVAIAALEEVRFLCAQQLAWLHSSELNETQWKSFSERLAAHVDVLVVRGEPVVHWLLSMLPASETGADAYGVASVLLETGNPQAAEGVLKTLETAEEGPLKTGLIRALGHGPPGGLLVALQAWFASGPAMLAVAAAEVLALHRKLDRNAGRLTDLLNDADPVVRRAAWRVAALVN